MEIDWTTLVAGAAAGVTTDRVLTFVFTAAVVGLEAKVAQAKADGVSDWADGFYPRMLKLVSKSKYNALKEQ